MRIERYEIGLQVAGRDRLLNSPAAGALMHGLLMEGVCDANLHAGSVRPFSQHLISRGEGAHVWVVNILNTDQAALLKRWLQDLPSKLVVKHYDLRLDVATVSRTAVSTYDELLESALETQLEEKSGDKVRVEFITPVCFKRNGHGNFYPFPDTRLLVQSLVRRWNKLGQGFQFEEDELLDEVDRQVLIKYFNMQSRPVSMDGISFSGGIGSLVLKCPRERHMLTMLHALLKYARFAGFGAKTAMGLGAAQVQWMSEPPKRKGGTRFSAKREPVLS